MVNKVKRSLLFICIGSLTFLQSDTAPIPPQTGELGSSNVLTITVRSGGQSLEGEVTVVKAPNSYNCVAYNGETLINCLEPGEHDITVSHPDHLTYHGSVNVVDSVALIVEMIRN